MTLNHTKKKKKKIDKMQQNSKCRLYGDRDETINQVNEAIECKKNKRLDM